MEWRIFPCDVLFFRGPEPMNAGETQVVSSLFPPAPNVLQGFVRTALLQTMGASLAEYADAARSGAMPSPSVAAAVELLGTPRPGDLGKLRLRGPFLLRRRGDACERLYPAPLDLAPAGEDPHADWRGQTPAPDMIESDLGVHRHLAAAPPSEPHWITEKGLGEYLAERPVPAPEVVVESTLAREELRVGIARDAATHAVREQHLYSIGLRRLEDRPVLGCIGLGLRVEGIEPDLELRCAGLHRMGGEGRLVQLDVAADGGQALLPASPAGGAAALRLVLLTPARWAGGWLPSLQAAGNGWRADFGAGPVTVVSAVVGKPQRIGGWDIVNNVSRPAEACVPAGSVFFVEEAAGMAASLHDSNYGAGANAGFGHIAAGCWTPS